VPPSLPVTLHRNDPTLVFIPSVLESAENMGFRPNALKTLVAALDGKALVLAIGARSRRVSGLK